MALDPRTRLGPYEIVSLVGAGGMGEIYKATDTRLGRMVAIKVITARLAVDASLTERFDREARIVSQVDHPHICPLYDIGVHEGTPYLVMPFLEGETLGARLQRGALPLDAALRCGIEILDALDAAHHAGITHRDLKPANVMLTRSGVKLLDFGVAKLRSQVVPAAMADSMTSAEPTALTTTGTFVGTLQYMSPEQLEGREGDARSDIFAFGTVLYEMLSGRKAFEGTSQAGVIAAILERDVPPLNLHALSPAVERVVRKSLAKDPDERWQTAKDLGDELRWILQEDKSAVPNSDTARNTATVAAGEPAVGPSRTRRRRRFIFRLTIGFSLSALIAAALVLRRTIDSTDVPTTAQSGTSATVPPSADMYGRSAGQMPRPGTATSGMQAQIRSGLRSLPADLSMSTLETYMKDVVEPCRALIEGRYPFGDANEIRRADFGELFGYGGRFDKFLTDHLTAIIDTSRRPWILRPDAAAAPPFDMVRQFEQADRIRQLFFNPGSRIPELQFVLNVSNVDVSATRLVLNFDGQRIEATPGARTAHPVVWPGPEEKGSTSATFEDRVATPETIAFEGPWSLFRFADATAVPATTQPVLGSTFFLRAQTKYHQAQLAIETQSGRNPFAMRAWRQFVCSPSQP